MAEVELIEPKNTATERLKHIVKNVAIFAVPVSLVSGAVEYWFHDPTYTALAVMVSVLVLYLAWIELRLRDVEARAYGKKN